MLLKEVGSTTGRSLFVSNTFCRSFLLGAYFFLMGVSVVILMGKFNSLIVEICEVVVCE